MEVAISLKGVINPDFRTSVQLRDWSDQVLARRLESIDGVAQIVLVGTTEEELQIAFDPAKINRYNLSIGELSSVISMHNQFTATGLLRDGWYRYALKVQSRFTTLDELEQLPIKQLGNGTVLTLGDLAEMLWVEARPRSFAFLDDQPLILAQIKKEFGRNTINVVESVYPILDELRTNFPDIEIRLLNEEASAIESTIQDLLLALGLGGLLAFIVLFIFLKDPYLPFTIGLSIPLSLLISFFVMYLLNIDLNVVSLGGLTLGIGLLVDNSIVVLENIKRHREMGKPMVQSAKEATKEIALAATASTFTTVSVFLPLLYLGGLQGVLFRDQALTLSISLLASLGVALFFLPPVSVAISGSSDPKKELFQSSLWLNKLFIRYENLLKKAIDHLAISFFIILGLLLLSIGLFFGLKKQIMPSQLPDRYSWRIRLPSNSDINTSKFAALDLQSHLKAFDSTLVVQSWGGFSDLTNLKSQSEEAMNRFKINVDVSNDNQRTAVPSIVQKWIEDKTGFSAEVLTEDETYGELLAFSTHPVLLYIERIDESPTLNYIEKLQSKIEQVKAGSEFSLNYPQRQRIITLQMNENARRIYNIPFRTILDQLKTIDRGMEVTQWIKGSEKLSVKLTRIEQTQDIGKLMIWHKSQRFRLEQLMHISIEDVPEIQERSGQLPVDSWVLNWTLADWFLHSDDLQDLLQTSEFRTRITRLAGLGVEIEALIDELSSLILLSLLIIFLILAAQFEHWAYPLFMLISVPLSWIGAFGLLHIMNLELSLFSGLGLIILSGIAVNDAILKIDFMKRYLAEFGDAKKAVFEAGTHRFRPVIMTSITTIIGLTPMLMPYGEQYELRQSLSASVVGGMVTSTILTLFVMPVLFYGYHRLKEKVTKTKNDERI